MESLPVELTLAPDHGLGREDAAGLAVVFALGGTLSWLSLYHPTELPPWAPWDFSWVEFLAAALAVWWYARGVIRAAPQARPSPWRQASFLLGVAAIYAVVQSHFDYMAQHEFFLNRIQHIFMHHLGPFLIALAWPGEALYRGAPAPFRRIANSRMLRQAIGVVQQPLLAAILFVGLIYLFLVPAVHFRAMIDPRLYAIMNWSMIGDGLLFWFLVLDPRPKPQAGTSFGTRMVLPFAVMFPQIALGSYIAFGPGGLYPLLRSVRPPVPVDHRGERPAYRRHRRLDSRRHDERDRLHDRAERHAHLRRQPARRGDRGCRGKPNPHCRLRFVLDWPPPLARRYWRWVCLWHRALPRRPRRR